MADNKTDASSSPRSDDPAIPTKGGLSAKPKTASHPAGAEPRLDTRFHRTSLPLTTPRMRGGRSPKGRMPRSVNGMLGDGRL